METTISLELEEKMKTILIKAYYNNFHNKETTLSLANQISAKMGLAYMCLSLDVALHNIRVFEFRVAGQKFVGYLLWSKDLKIYGADKSRFFLLLSEFGLVSGIEILKEEELKYNLWTDLLLEKSKDEIIERMNQLNEEADFAKDHILFQRYREIVEELPDELFYPIINRA